IIQPKVEEAYLSAQARIASEDEWSKEGYLRGLQDLWENEMKERWIDNTEDEEASRIYSELKRYTEQVEKETEAIKEDLIYDMDDLSLDALKIRAVNKLIEDHSDNALVKEFGKRQIFYATREATDHNKRYFKSMDELDRTSENVINRLREVYAEISVEAFEG